MIRLIAISCMAHSAVLWLILQGAPSANLHGDNHVSLPSLMLHGVAAGRPEGRTAGSSEYAPEDQQGMKEKDLVKAKSAKKDRYPGKETLRNRNERRLEKKRQSDQREKTKPVEAAAVRQDGVKEGGSFHDEASSGKGKQGETGISDGGERAFGSSEGPDFAYRAEPAYPMRARRQGLQGDVVLRLRLDAQGRAVRTEIISSPHEMLSQSALKAVAASRFRPCRILGTPVACATQLTIRFRLQ